MPSFHYETERWGIQFVIDPKSFAERHSPFFRGSPVKTKQMKLMFSSAARTARHPEVPACQILMEGWGVENERSEREWFIPKDKSSFNFTKKQERKEKLPILWAGQDKVLSL